MGSSMEVRKSKLTETAVAALKPAAKEYEVHDTIRDGLRLCVNPGGTKSWTLFYHRDGRSRRIGLGRYPWVSLSRARERAAEAVGRIKGPERADPAREIAVQRTAPTFGELAALFLDSRHFATRAVSTQKELRRIVEVDLLPEWEQQRLSAIDRPQIQRWGDRIVSEGRTYMANRCREYMQLIWHWGLGRTELAVPPSPFYKLPKPFLGERPRDRVLSHEEIRRVFAAIEHEPRITAGWWVMLFLTAARDKSEVMRMEKVEVDRDRRVWVIPREKTKAKRSLVLPLSGWALEVLDAVGPLSGRSGFFFPSPKDDGPMSSARRAATRLQERAGVEFEVRDIRRTVATGMTEIEIDPEIVDRILNHAIPSESRVTKTYQTTLLWAKLREKREAIEKWAQHLDQVVLKGHGREAANRAITTARTYEGWNKWSSVGRAKRRQETWAERKSRLAAVGRSLVDEHRARQAAARIDEQSEGERRRA
jgi:integrase